MCELIDSVALLLGNPLDLLVLLIYSGNIYQSLFFLATPFSMWNLSSLTRDLTGAPYLGSSES